MTAADHPIQKFLQMIAETQDDQLDCDQCLQHIARYVETHLQGLTLCEQLTQVRVHLESCPCCKDEFTLFVEAIESLANLDD